MSRLRTGRNINRPFIETLAINIFLILLGMFMALPLVYAVSSSLKPLDEIWMFPPKFFVRNPTLKNFKDLLSLMGDSWVPFSRYVFNTVFVAVVGTAGNVILSSMCAYGLAKLKHPLKNKIFNLIVLALMFNGTVTAIPNFLILSKLHLVDSYLALILPAFATPLGLYLMKQFIEQIIPDSLLEAARIDGSSEFRTFYTIVMPLVKSAWLTLIIFSFQSLWNLGTTNLIQSEHLKTVNYALSQIVSAGISRTGTASAATVVMMIIPILVFVFSQSNVVESMATSGMKD